MMEYPDNHNHSDHAIILKEIQNLNATMKEAISLFRTEAERRDTKLQEDIDAVKSDLARERTKQQLSDQRIDTMFSLMKFVGAPVASVACIALAKAFGLW